MVRITEIKEKCLTAAQIALNRKDCCIRSPERKTVQTMMQTMMQTRKQDLENSSIPHTWYGPEHDEQLGQLNGEENGPDDGAEGEVEPGDLIALAYGLAWVNMLGQLS